jgi:zinc protease
VQQLLAGWKPAGQMLPPVDYTSVAYAPKIVLIDHPEAKQSAVRIGVPAYTIQSDDKFAGAVANRILSGGIEARLMKYVRAEKGLAYSTYGVFAPSRHGGQFEVETSTAVESTTDAVKAVFHVLEQMRQENVTPEELTAAQTRVAGGMLMQLQTIAQQAQFRVDGILNGYPIDYYDKYPERITQVTADEVRAVMRKYVDPKQMTIITVAPAAAVQDELRDLGEINVRPMPTKRDAPATQPAEPRELLKKAA